MDERSGEIYIPAGLSSGLPPLLYLVRSNQSPSDVAREVALILRQDFPEVLVRKAETFDDTIGRNVRLHRFRTVVFGVAGGAALVLAAVGIAGLVATGVARRLREIGIRAVLGARRRQLVNMLVLDHLRPAIIGVAFGLLASWWVSRLVRAFLYEIEPHEPWVWAAAVLTVLCVVIFVAWIPARRAGTADPAAVLRTE